GGWYRFGLLGLAVLAGGLASRARTVGGGSAAGWQAAWREAVDRETLLRGAGWLAPALLVVALAYFATAEDLQTVLLRNTVERRVMQFWRATTGDERFAARATGGFSGTV